VGNPAVQFLRLPLDSDSLDDGLRLTVTSFDPFDEVLRKYPECQGIFARLDSYSQVSDPFWHSF
jgi:hypothetical protein